MENVSADDWMAAQMAFTALLVVALDQSGAIDGEKLAALQLSIAGQNPNAGQKRAMQLVGEQIAAHVQHQRARSQPPKTAPH